MAMQAVQMADGGGGGVTGYSEASLRSTINRLQDAYNLFYKEVCDNQQTKFINVLANYWYCKEAQNYFKSLKEEMDNILDDTTTSFRYVHMVIKRSAERWAQATGSTIKILDFTHQSKKLDITGIKEEGANGYKGADQQKLNDSINTLEQIKSKASQALTNAKNAVNRCGFSDDESNQQAALTRSLEKLQTAIQSSVDSAIASLKKAINETISKYGGIISKNSIDFGSISFTAGDALAGNFISKENVLTQYWDDDENHQLKVTVMEDGSAMISEVQPDGTEVPMGWTTQDALNTATGSSTIEKSRTSDDARIAAEWAGNDTYRTAGAPTSTSTTYANAYEQDKAYIEAHKSELESKPAYNSGYANLYEEEAARIHTYEGTLKHSPAGQSSYTEQRMETHEAASSSTYVPPVSQTAAPTAAPTSAPTAAPTTATIPYTKVTPTPNGGKKASIAGHEVYYDKDGNIIGGR